MDYQDSANTESRNDEAESLKYARVWICKYRQTTL